MNTKSCIWEGWICSIRRQK